MNAPKRALSSTAFATLLLVALMMGANHVAARLAFNNGVDVATAVAFRSGVTASVLSILLFMQHAPMALKARHKRYLPAIGLLIGERDTAASADNIYSIYPPDVDENVDASWGDSCQGPAVAFE